MNGTAPHIPDLRTYAFHEKAAEILSANPERLAEVTAILDHWEKLEGSQAQGWALKWKELIGGLSVPEISELIVRQDEQMDFYRKSSPFACLLSDDDRISIIRKYKFN